MSRPQLYFRYDGAEILDIIGEEMFEQSQDVALLNHPGGNREDDTINRAEVVRRLLAQADPRLKPYV
jgi:hypothetical protein